MGAARGCPNIKIWPRLLFRNLVALPTAPAAAAGGGSSSAQDTNRRIRRGLLERLFADNVMDLLLVLAQHARDQPFR